LSDVWRGDLGGAVSLLERQVERCRVDCVTPRQPIPLCEPICVLRAGAAQWCYTQSPPRAERRCRRRVCPFPVAVLVNTIRRPSGTLLRRTSHAARPDRSPICRHNGRASCCMPALSATPGSLSCSLRTCVAFPSVAGNPCTSATTRESWDRVFSVGSRSGGFLVPARTVIRPSATSSACFGSFSLPT